MDERIALGRQRLMAIANVDFGYDLARWHEHLKVNREGGYTWNRTVALPKIMHDALASEDWRDAVERLASSPGGDGDDDR